MVVLVTVGGVWLWRAGFLQELSNKEELITALRQSGIKGPLLCIGAQFVQVVIFAIPGEITQFASGYVFGTWQGFLYSIIGIMAGSAFNFYFARIVGRPTLERFISPKTLDKADQALNGAKGKAALFLLFLLPGAPKDAMCYGAGLSKMTLREFVVITGVARSPALFISILMGGQAARREYGAMVLTAALATLAAAGYYIYRYCRNRRLADSGNATDRETGAAVGRE